MLANKATGIHTDSASFIKGRKTIEQVLQLQLETKRKNQAYIHSVIPTPQHTEQSGR